MKYRFSALRYQLIAYLLAAVCLAFGFLSGMTTVNCLAMGMYASDTVFQTTWQCRSIVDNEANVIIDKFRQNPDYDKWSRLLEDSNLRFIIVDESTGDVKASYLEGLSITAPANLKDNVYMDEYNAVFALGEKGSIFENVYVVDCYFGSNWVSDTSYWARLEWETEHAGMIDGVYGENGALIEQPAKEEPEEEFESYQLLCLLPKTIEKRGTGDRFYEGDRVYRTFRMYRNGAPVVLGVCAAVSLACLIFLFFQAGHKLGQEEPRGSWVEKIPLEVLLLTAVFAVLGICAMVAEGYDAANNAYITVGELQLIYGLFAAGSVVCGTVFLGTLVSFAARVKLGKWWDGSLCWRAMAWCGRGMKKCFGRVWELAVQGVRSVGMVPRAALVILAALFVELLGFLWLVNTWYPALPVVLLVLFNGFLLLAAIWAVAQMRILQQGAKALADGNLENQVDTGRMYWDFKRHGEYLNAISGGMTKAVEKQMRSERLKTELITNVSHDIKTPLTSIVNYVDLLQKPHTDAEGIQYLEVLDRQSKRLKKLTENLVEASKASTGNIAVHLEPTSVMELVNQAVEEYRDRMEAGKLETVVNLRGDLMVMADGKLMWRILDNLLNNVVKYALAGTRVYVTAQKWGERVVIAVKNISRDPLNVDADELMERFVRGDSSRHTEGSGLGLNIARSLTQLQSGEFNLTVDGDLFKAEVSLPVAQVPQDG